MCRADHSCLLNPITAQFVQFATRPGGEIKRINPDITQTMKATVNIKLVNILNLNFSLRMFSSCFILKTRSLNKQPNVPLSPSKRRYSITNWRIGVGPCELVDIYELTLQISCPTCLFTSSLCAFSTEPIPIHQMGCPCDGSAIEKNRFLI